MRVILILISLFGSFTWVSAALGPPRITPRITTVRALQSKIQRVTQDALRIENRQERYSVLRSFRLEIARAVESARRDAPRNAEDGANLFVTLAGFDEDLGLFLDGPEEALSDFRCQSVRTSLIRSYAGESASLASLPLHTHESLKLLDVLCKK